MSHKTTLGEVGDLSAPPGSRLWAIAVRDELNMAIRKAEFNAGHAKKWFDGLSDKEAWKVLCDAKGRPFRNFEAFCQYRKPFGLGHQRKSIEHLISKRAQEMAADENHPKLARHGEIGNGRSRGDNITSTSLRGTSDSYLVSRLERDFPNIHAALARGEYPSARAACIAAGIVKVRTPLEETQFRFLKLSASDRKRFDKWRAEL